MIGLKNCRLFSDLPPDELCALEQIAEIRTYSADQLIFQEGDAGDGLYLILDGRVQIRGQVSPEEQRVLSRLELGDYFGEIALMDNEPRSATASAERVTVAAFLPRDKLMPILLKSAELAINLNRQFSRRMREFNHQYLQEVLQAERLALVGRFARTIVHDFKNPLSIISLAAAIVDSPQATTEMRQVAQRRIQAQVDRLNNMANELLEFTRSSSPRNTLVLSDYAEFLQTLIEDIRHEVATKSVRFIVPSELPHIRIMLDGRRLAHVFYNLINNAVDAMPCGGQVFLRFRKEAKQIITEIEDTGTGIAPEIADRLFEPFATYGKSHGTGLGLSICRRILEDHQGQIHVRNAPSGSAVFWFSLPIPE